MGDMLELRNLVKSFGGVKATRDVSMRVAPGEVRGIIGPNGAGKSTLFNLISGHLRPSSGSVIVENQNITSKPPYKRARHGISIVFQGARVFPEMTVLENVMVGAHARTTSGFTRALLRTSRFRTEERTIRADSLAALERVGLEEWSEREASSLPLGQQRRMQIARALVSKPKLLLLDEPASGLRALERQELVALIRDVQAAGVAILFIEHDVSMVMQVADRISVLVLGELLAEGTPEEIRANVHVIDAYLGTEVEHA